MCVQVPKQDWSGSIYGGMCFMVEDHLRTILIYTSAYVWYTEDSVHIDIFSAGSLSASAFQRAAMSPNSLLHWGYAQGALWSLCFPWEFENRREMMEAKYPPCISETAFGVGLYSATNSRGWKQRKPEGNSFCRLASVSNNKPNLVQT